MFRTYAAARLHLLLAALLFAALLPLAPLLPPAQEASAATLSFTAQPFGPTCGVYACVLAAGDLNGDGHLDVVRGQQGEGSVHLGDGAGGFVGTLNFTTTFRTIDTLLLGDLNGDEALDIVSGSQVFLNNGGFATGTNYGEIPFSSAPRALGDIDGDGDLDILVQEIQPPDPIPVYRTGFYLNNGAGAFPSMLPITSAEVRRVALGDVDGDGRLDVVTITRNGPHTLYLNAGGSPPSFSPLVFEPDAEGAWDLVLGDINGDGRLDIVTMGQFISESRYYLNAGGSPPSFTQGTVDPSRSAGHAAIALADMDSDGDLDVVMGNISAPNQIFINDGAAEPSFSPQSFGPLQQTYHLAVADLNADGAPDIITGNERQQSVVYLNTAQVGFGISPLGERHWTSDIALGDMNGDGILDAVTGNRFSAGQILFGDGTGAFPNARDLPTDEGPEYIALGDMNGDGTLDVVGSDGVLLLNDGLGNLRPIPISGLTQAPSLGDMDGDGDLDIVERGRVFRNNGGAEPTFSVAITPTAFLSTNTLGDLDGDGDLDLLFHASGVPASVYLNDGSGNLSFKQALPGTPKAQALGDMNGDGALDIVTAAGPGQVQIFFNDGQASFGAARSFGSTAQHNALDLADLNGDGALDIVVGVEALSGAIGPPISRDSRIFLNDGQGNFDGGIIFDQGADVVAIASGDLNGDGALDFVIANEFPRQNINPPPDAPASFVHLNRRTAAGLLNQPPAVALTRPGPTPDAAGYSTPAILDTQVIPVSYTLRDREGDPLRSLRAEFSLDGGGTWRPAVLSGLPGLTTSPGGTQHSLLWDTFASGFFGQSDNVALRLLAYPGGRGAPNSTPDSFQRPYASAISSPFRVRGTQVRVLQDSTPVAGALVYRLPAGRLRGAEPLGDGRGQLFRSNTLGFLNGRGELALGDQLVALLPISATESYSLYFTSAAPSPDGLSLQAVTTPGVQTLNVLPSNPLILFNLDVALEWDARNDAQYLGQLQLDLQKASELLFDWTDGQAALGDLRVFHDARRLLVSPPRAGLPNLTRWDDAHIRIYATNRLRPNANQGGIVSEDVAETLTLGAVPKTISYAKGQIRMGAVWNRYGEAFGTLGEDWPRTLAHELGHFALFLDDNYLGLDASGRLVSVAGCRGAMSDPYGDANGEFHPRDASWEANCAQTLSERLTGRADWQTIKRFYDRPDVQGANDFTLNAPASFDANPGPRALPLALTRLSFGAPASASQALEDPLFALTLGGAAVQPSARARAVLYPKEGDRLIDLGRPTLDKVSARGARAGDRLCVYDPALEQLGCANALSAGGRELALVAKPGWSPDLLITPVTSRTLALSVSVSLAAGQQLVARLFPAEGSATAPLTLTQAGSTYEGRFELAQPSFEGHVQVWVAEQAPRREAMTDYSVGGAPGPRKARDAPRSSPGPRKARDTPLLSPDGQVVLFGDTLSFGEGQFYSLQSATSLPPPPPGRAPVGQGYWLRASANAPDLRQASINIAYLSREAPAVEDGIRLYVWDGVNWTQLATALDSARNEASAQAQGPGLYVLMTSLEVPLNGPGWNLISYPLQGSRPVGDALRSIQGFYLTVYGYNPDNSADLWELYDVDTPAWVNDLSLLRFGRGYWIYATQAITLQLSNQARTGRQQVADGVPSPPATFYGQLVGGEGLSVTAGLPVVATINGIGCGQGTTREVEGQIVYVLDVVADGQVQGCGASGRSVRVTVNNQPTTPVLTWRSGRPQAKSLALTQQAPMQPNYLPLLLR